jgi:hypothetical protein
LFNFTDQTAAPKPAAAESALESIFLSPIEEGTGNDLSSSTPSFPDTSHSSNAELRNLGVLLLVGSPSADGSFNTGLTTSLPSLDLSLSSLSSLSSLESRSLPSPGLSNPRYSASIVEQLQPFVRLPLSRRVHPLDTKSFLGFLGNDDASQI